MDESNSPFGFKMQLYSETGYNLTVRPDGGVLGTQDDSDEDSYIEVTAGGEVSYVRLLGISSNLYICFRSNGELYGEGDSENDGTLFIEQFLGSYSTYKSALYPEWYIAIKKDGTPKKGFKTKYGQKAVKFLPRRLD